MLTPFQGIGLFILFVLISIILFRVYMHFSYENKVAFKINREVTSLPENVKRTFITSFDGTKIEILSFLQDNPSFVLLFCHGNACNAYIKLPFAENFYKMGGAVILFSYRGYANSEGTPSENAIYRDAQYVYNYVKKLYPNVPLLVMGQSLGSAVAIDLAFNKKVNGIILEGAFTSAKDMAKVMLGDFAWFYYFGIYKFDSETKIKYVDIPKLFIHSKKDDTVPYILGKKLYKIAPLPKEFIAFEEEGHCDLSEKNPEKYWKAIKDFIFKNI